MDEGTPLRGGTANAGAVRRMGDAVIRPAGPQAATIHALLRHLHEVGFDAVPEPLGFESEVQERLRFIPGDVPFPPFPAWSQTERALATTASLLRRFHDAQDGFAPPLDGPWSDEMADPQGGVVICHNDVCPENVVFRHGEAVALIDFDFAAPGRREYDLAQLSKMCVPLDTDEDATRFGRGGLDPYRRLRVVADGYGLPPGRDAFLDVVRESIASTRAGGFVRQQVGQGNEAFIQMTEQMGGLDRYERRYQWFERNRQRFADALG